MLAAGAAAMAPHLCRGCAGLRCLAVRSKYLAVAQRGLITRNVYRFPLTALQVAMQANCASSMPPCCLLCAASCGRECCDGNTHQHCLGY